MACSHIVHCELHPQFAFNSALKIWQTHFCEADFTRCARYHLSLAGQPVPLNLLPNGKLIEAPRSGGEYGATAMFNAIQKRRLPMVVSLLRAGINVNSQNSEGTSPLMAAASVGAEEIVRLLLEKGADPSIPNLQGETAHDIAMRAGHAGIAALVAGRRPAASASSAAPVAKRAGLLSRLFASH